MVALNKGPTQAVVEAAILTGLETVDEAAHNKASTQAVVAHNKGPIQAVVGAVILAGLETVDEAAVIVEAEAEGVAAGVMVVIGASTAMTSPLLKA